ncbi:Putative_reverse transcriptase/endonuclease [Hexamita inflata]|uniref:Reverse transcriptase/endonuclease n=1 Tax=Hexamita inflata TaxID=28002 RepID=A0AA86V3X0_9EUKA|nr:Putative reverse transcriptase/endonuclease [Hexamita inflata]
MHQDMTNKIIIDAQSHKEAHNLQQGVAQHYFREERLKVKAKELQQNTVDDSVPKTGYVLLGYGRLTNEACLIDMNFGKIDPGIPQKCELCGNQFKPGHEMSCKKINDMHIKVHDIFANYLEQKLRKTFSAKKVCAAEDNRAMIKPDVELIIKGQKVYLDIGISFDPKRYYQTKESHYASMLMVTPSRLFPQLSGKIVRSTQNQGNSLRNQIQTLKTYMKKLATFQRLCFMCRRNIQKKVSNER